MCAYIRGKADRILPDICTKVILISSPDALDFCNFLKEKESHQRWMGHHKKYIYRKKHPVLIRSNIIHTYLDQSQSRCLVKCHSRNTDQCIFGKLSVKLFAEMWGSRGKFWGLFCRIGIYSHIPHCLCLLPANSIFNRRPSWNCNKISAEKNSTTFLEKKRIWKM